MAGRRLRVGVLLDSAARAPAWMRRVLLDVADGAHSTLALVVTNASPARRPRRTLRSAAYSAYLRADRLLWGSRLGAPDALADVGIADVVARAERQLAVTPIETRHTDRFPEEAVEEVRRADLDVLLRFGFRIVKGEILTAARHGMWSYHHGDNDFYRGGPALFWEMYDDNPVSGVVLQILNEELDGGRVIYKSYSATHPYSLALQRNAPYWKASAFVGRKLRDLALQGADALQAVPPSPDARPRIGRNPTNAQATRFAARAMARIATEKLRARVAIPQWFLAAKAKGGSTYGNIYPPRDRFWADPFVMDRAGRSWVFFEEFPYATNKGVIACAEIDDAGAIGERRVALEESFHLSYPCVFEDDGALYMIPESVADRSVRLYRCVEFPHRWQLEGTLLSDTAAVDATLHRDDAGYWLFANVAEPGASTHDELHVFFADALRGPWHPHPRNPVVSDVRCARPAGALFRRQDILYRPGQNSARCYGHSISLRAVEVLTREEYRERPAGAIPPAVLQGSDRIHTLNSSGRIEVVDGCRTIRRLRLA